ncbi:homoserine kinase [Brachyspira pilosicoli]|uniref:Homoserine kinase n=1 Tax=Brachyspira pilosicoli TaxID=52584 RepID=A0A5C8FAW0_BRAPL|nr:homoserine kinase [Brachyspira pilosicoli]TXJ47417.1 homoserine kinase [Brachyspira pilosicoli]
MNKVNKKDNNKISKNKKLVTFKIPATSANIGSGFDSVGLALDLYNEIHIYENENSKKIEFQIIGEGEKEISKDNNMILDAMKLVYKKLKEKTEKGYIIKCVNRIPLSRGLGSSSAAIIGGLLSANYILGNKLSFEGDILNMAVQLEGHPDNVSPAILGGIVSGVVRKNEDFKYVKINAPKNLKAIVAIPNFHLSTEKARNTLPKEISFKDAIFNISRAALLTSALSSNRLDLLEVSTDDKLHQDYRAKFIPGLKELFKEAKKAGSYSVTISGAGSSILALVKNDEKIIKDVSNAMKESFSKKKIESEIKVLNIPNKGIIII